ncbi:hypothetical protein CSB96_3543 [Pseudomonas aeruginosa]|nr:hypothetical protein CSB96_3543 [Pseudomonas aeruginosa]
MRKTPGCGTFPFLFAGRHADIAAARRHDAMQSGYAGLPTQKEII